MFFFLNVNLTVQKWSHLTCLRSTNASRWHQVTVSVSESSSSLFSRLIQMAESLRN